jgi:hypothetical protein
MSRHQVRGKAPLRVTRTFRVERKAARGMSQSIRRLTRRLEKEEKEIYGRIKRIRRTKA